MKYKKCLSVDLLILLTILLVPKQAEAISFGGIIRTGETVWTRIQERFEYVLAFGADKKIEVLDKQADRRLEKAQMYAEEGDGERVENMVSNYGEIKSKQDALLDKVDDGKVVNQVAERVVEQQQTMEEIKNWLVDPGTKEQMIQVQEQVVNQVATRVVEVNGTEGQTEFLNEVVHVWAPGTGPGGGAGVVYEGGGKLMFAPGTSEGGPANVDIQNVIIESDSGGKQIQGQ